MTDIEHDEGQSTSNIDRGRETIAATVLSPNSAKTCLLAHCNVLALECWRMCTEANTTRGLMFLKRNAVECCVG